MLLKILIIISLSLVWSCNEIDLAKDDPACLPEEIKDFKKFDLCKDASVDLYEFLGSNVFVFSQGSCCCDRGSEVLNNDCEQLGILGGFTGNTIINGVDFSNAIYVRSIWEK